MKPYIHAQNSVKRWGGTVEDFLPIHDFFDSSKAHVPDMRHRAILHSSFGIYIAERVFGTYITISTGKVVQVRDIGEQHVIDDLGRIPTVQDYLGGMPYYDWLGGPKTMKRHIEMQDKPEKAEKKKTTKERPLTVKELEAIMRKLQDEEDKKPKIWPVQPQPPIQPYTPPTNPWDTTRIID